MLYLFGAFWLPVVWMQMRTRDLAAAVARERSALPPTYFTLFRTWVRVSGLRRGCGDLLAHDRPTRAQAADHCLIVAAGHGDAVSSSMALAPRVGALHLSSGIAAGSHTTSHTLPQLVHPIAKVDVECERAVLEAVAAGFLRMLLATSPWQPTSP